MAGLLNLLVLAPRGVSLGLKCEGYACAVLSCPPALSMATRVCLPLWPLASVLSFPRERNGKADRPPRHRTGQARDRTGQDSDRTPDARGGRARARKGRPQAAIPS